MRANRRRWAVIAAVAALGLAACGSNPDGSASDDVASVGTDAPTATEATGADDSTSPDDTTATDLDPEEAMLAFTECMRDHGIDMADPVMAIEGQAGTKGGGVVVQLDEVGEGGPGAVNPANDDFVEANEECQPLLEDAMGEIEIDPEQQAEMREQMLDFAECIRDHGVDFPDPVLDADGRVTMSAGGPMEDMDPDAMNEATEACGEIMGGNAPFSVHVDSGSDGSGD